MEEWVVTAAIALTALIGNAFIIKYMVGQHEKRFDSNDSVHKTLFARLDAHGDVIVSLNTKAENAVTIKEVSDEFLRKEMFVQFRTHTDEKFKDLKEDLANQYKLLERINHKMGGD